MMDATGENSGKNSEPLNVFNASAIFLLSCSIIVLQIVLMRSLAVLRYHHFSYFVVSTALLGFGASGTFLHFASRKLCKNFFASSLILLALFTLAVPTCYTLSLLLPIDIQYIFYSAKQLMLLLLYGVLLFVPFFFGASTIGLAIHYYKKKTGWIYGLNLLGSGFGGVIAIIMMYRFPPLILPYSVSFIALTALISWFLSIRSRLSGKQGLACLLAMGLIISLMLKFVMQPPAFRTDPYKAASHLQRLQKQSDAALIISRFSPRGQIDIYRSDKLHHTLFASLGNDLLPPDQLTILIDGHHAAGMFKIQSEKDAGIVDATPQSLAYRFIRSPKVLLLGEKGGVNVWLAIRNNAREITVVQGNPQLVELLERDLSGEIGDIYNRPNVNVIRQDPRLFVTTTNEKFDIIHIASGEGFSAGASGLISLHEDYLLTTEGISDCYQKLSDHGLLTLTRGIQFPPRDNIKIFGLLSSALECAGVADPRQHLLQTRNYLAVNTMLSKSPLDRTMITTFERICQKFPLDLEYHPFIKSDKIHQFNILDGPSEKNYSYFHHAALSILSEKRDQFEQEWVYNIRAPTDNSPYFYNFFKWGSLTKFIEVYGRQLFQKLELGYMILVLAFLEAVLMAFIMILFPLFFVEIKRKPQIAATAVYFLSIGFAFMFIEMVLIQKFTKFLGDPIYAVSVVLVAILLSAGLGSICQNHVTLKLVTKILIAISGILLLSMIHGGVSQTLMAYFSASGLALRILVTCALIMPLSFLMGWLFPVGINCLQAKNSDLVPWAWGVNGFGSVSAVPLAVILSMEFGFTVVILIALGLYVLAGASCIRLIN